MIARKRKPWLAVTISLFAPGLGHLYCGRLGRAIWIFAGCWACFTVIKAILVYGRLGVFNLVLSIAIGIGYWLFVMVDAARIARQSGADYVLRLYNRWYIYIAMLVLAVFMPDADRILKQAIRLYMIPGLGVYKAYRIPSSGMENALTIGDYLIADMTAYRSKAPERGDVIVFRYPLDGKTQYIKRCVAIPGDTIEIRDKQVWINQRAVPSLEVVKFIDNKIISGEISPRDNFGPFRVPPNSYFVLGDSRDNSYDSRFWGPVPAGNVLGKAMRIHWSEDPNRIGKAID